MLWSLGSAIASSSAHPGQQALELGQAAMPAVKTDILGAVGGSAG
jgi:hypothetical protein